MSKTKDILLDGDPKEYEVFKKLVRVLLLEMCNQREKVPGTLAVLLPELYPDPLYGDRFRAMVRDRILERIDWPVSKS